jgi:hypothetical protein
MATVIVQFSHLFGRAKRSVRTGNDGTDRERHHVVLAITVQPNDIEEVGRRLVALFICPGP